jgi:hypothetical protein
MRFSNAAGGSDTGFRALIGSLSCFAVHPELAGSTTPTVSQAVVRAVVLAVVLVVEVVVIGVVVAVT